MKVSLSIIFTTLCTLAAAKDSNDVPEMVGSSSTSTASGNIADIASSLPDFTTLVALVTVDDPAIQPVLSRLTGDAPTSKYDMLLTTVNTSTNCISS